MIVWWLSYLNGKPKTSAAHIIRLSIPNQDFQYLPNYRTDTVPKAKSQYPTSLTGCKPQENTAAIKIIIRCGQLSCPIAL